MIKKNQKLLITYLKIATFYVYMYVYTYYMYVYTYVYREKAILGLGDTLGYK